MHDIPAKIEEKQRAFCRERGAGFLASPGSSKLGFALATREKNPLHGLRHNPVGDTNGWYLWCGDEYSTGADFFQPLHTEHMYGQFPALTTLLGLAPGYRFLLSGDYIDVWFDASLLAI